VWRPLDSAIFIVGRAGDYLFWDQSHTASDISDERNENPPTYARGSFTAYHPNYGLMFAGGGVTSGIKSRRIPNGQDHYSAGSQNDADDFLTITGLPTNSDTNYDLAITRNGHYFVCLKTMNNASSTPITRDSLTENQFGPMDEPSPAWGGSATEILNDGASNTYLPESDGSHPDGSGLDPEIWDVHVISDDPEVGGGLHYFARYEWQGHGNESGSVVYQYEGNTFELLTDLDDFHDNLPTTYPEYGFIAPAVEKGVPTNVGIAVWEHVKIATDNHTLKLRILRRSGVQGSPGTWTWETVKTITGITDALIVASPHGWAFKHGITGSTKAGIAQTSPGVDYAFDRDGNEHLVYHLYDSGTDPRRQVYYRYKDNSAQTPAWTSELKISTGTAWANFITSSTATSIYALSILKDNGYVPWNGTDLRVAWAARRYDSVEATFVGGIQNATGQDAINIYAPEVFMNYRDDTAGPEDMLW
jgi:hypothetical protein